MGNRKKIIINPAFQWHMIRLVMVLCLGVIVTLYAAIYYFFWKFNHIVSSVGLGPDHIFVQFLAQQRAYLDGVFAITAVVTFLAVTVFGALYSHRIAGPLYKLRRHLREVAAGEHVRPVSFRKNDYFPELAEAANEVISKKGGAAG